MIGYPKKKDIINYRKIVKFQPKMPFITEFKADLEYQRNFYDNYVNQNEQDFNAKQCSRCGQKDKPYRIRIHFMKHFDSMQFVKYRCERCFKNYARLDRLRSHADNGQCFIDLSEYPQKSYFIDKVLRENPQQNPSSKICSKCCLTFTTVNDCKKHFMSCLRIGYPCCKF